MDNTNQSSFWQFSDNLRHQTSTLADLSLNDSIWSANYAAKRPAEQRRNFDFRNPGADAGSNLTGDTKTDFNDVGFNNDVWGWKAPINDSLSGSNVNYSPFGAGGGPDFAAPVPRDPKPDFNNLGFNNDAWKAPINESLGGLNGKYSGFGSGLNGGFNKGIYSSPSLNFNSYSKGRGFANNVVANGKVIKGGKNEDVNGGKHGKKNKGNREGNKDNKNNGNGENKNAVDKRFKTLPPAEALPRNETIGGYIFVCNNDTMAENLKRQLFGLPPRYRDSVRSITPGLPLFLYNYSTHQLHGIFEAASFGGSNIDPSAWEDKKNPGESRFPAQVRVVTRKICEPLEEDSFRPILHHYDGPKFRLELNIPEVLSLLDIFEENNA
ncbi:DCD (Development and Cell Death) domain protein [Striga asiatica]|uniref:DCD (Development and Cell Death) domain protein n=1 Tax=Striga asiatica TaxID=4170 RepID=A0A5A7RK06_STRAF|nr:DCD (Development and Cell Death) domain protein [Striga asiatica]